VHASTLTPDLWHESRLQHQQVDGHHDGVAGASASAPAGRTVQELQGQGHPPILRLTAQHGLLGVGPLGVGLLGVGPLGEGLLGEGLLGVGPLGVGLLGVGPLSEGPLGGGLLGGGPLGGGPLGGGPLGGGPLGGGPLGGGLLGRGPRLGQHHADQVPRHDAGG